MTRLDLDCLTVADSVLVKNKDSATIMEVKEIRQYKEYVSVTLVDEASNETYVSGGDILQDDFILV